MTGRNPLQTQPLLRFSLYTAWQAQVILRKGDDLLQIASDWSPENIIEIDEYDADFWLWTLGAFELFRTMAQHSECFGEEFSKLVRETKSRLARLRVPFAKQELSSRKGPIWDEASVKGLDGGLVYIIDGHEENSTQLINTVKGVLEGVSSKDIIGRIPERNALEAQ